MKTRVDTDLYPARCASGRAVLAALIVMLAVVATGHAETEPALESGNAQAAQIVSNWNPDELRRLRQQVQALQTAQVALSNDLRQLKAALRTKNGGAQLGPIDSEITIFDPGTVQGDSRAEVILVEFADYNCSFCRRFFEETFPRIKEEYLDAGKVRYMFCDFPFLSVHPTAALAAEAAHCAAEQGAFWPMHDWLMRNSAELNPNILGRQAEALGLDASSFRECLAQRKHSALVDEEMSEAIQAGIKGTPTFFLGRAEPNGRKIKIERTIQGAPPFSFFQQNLNDLLERRAKTPGALTAQRPEYLR